MTGGVQPRNAGLVQARARRASGRKASAGKARGWAERSGTRRVSRAGREHGICGAEGDSFAMCRRGATAEEVKGRALWARAGRCKRRAKSESPSEWARGRAIEEKLPERRNEFNLDVCPETRNACAEASLNSILVKRRSSK